MLWTALNLFFIGTSFLAGWLQSGSMTSGFFGAGTGFIVLGITIFLAVRFLSGAGLSIKAVVLGWWVVPFALGFVSWLAGVVFMGVSSQNLVTRVMISLPFLVVSFVVSRRLVNQHASKQTHVVDPEPVFGIQVGRVADTGLPIAFGEHTGNFSNAKIIPQALLVAPSGSGKTTALRSIITNAFSHPQQLAVSVFAMSTKIDVLPTSLSGIDVTVLLPAGLTNEAQVRMHQIEQSGASVHRGAWDPVEYLFSRYGTDLTSPIVDVDRLQSLSLEIQTLANSIIESVQDKNGEGAIWHASSVALLSQLMLAEIAVMAFDLHDVSELPAPVRNSTEVDELADSAIAKMIEEVRRQDQTTYHGMWAVALEIVNNAETFLMAKDGLETATTMGSLNPKQKQLLSKGAFLETAISILADHAQKLKSGDKMASSIHAIVRTGVDYWTRPSLAYRDSAVDVAKWSVTPRMVIAMVCPSEQFNVLAPLASSLLTALWMASARENKPMSHMFVLDEAANLTPLQSLPNWVSQGRGYKNHILAALQSEVQASKWTKSDNAAWILGSWPTVFVASGTPLGHLGDALVKSSGKQLVTRQSQSGSNSMNGNTSSWSEQHQWEDRVLPQNVFSNRVLGVWRMIDGNLGPWVNLG